MKFNSEFHNRVGEMTIYRKDSLVLGIFNYSAVFSCSAKGVTGNQRKENINSQEMTDVKTTSSVAANNPVVVES